MQNLQVASELQVAEVLLLLPGATCLWTSPTSTLAPSATTSPVVSPASTAALVSLPSTPITNKAAAAATTPFTAIKQVSCKPCSVQYPACSTAIGPAGVDRASDRAATGQAVSVTAAVVHDIIHRETLSTGPHMSHICAGGAAVVAATVAGSAGAHAAPPRDLCAAEPRGSACRLQDPHVSRSPPLSPL